MCGIVGLFLKDDALQPLLGGLLAQMLGIMSDRGPDSAGFAVYGSDRPGHIKLTLRRRGDGDLRALAADLARNLGADMPIALRDSHAVLQVPDELEPELRRQLSGAVDVIAAGRRMEIYKEVGLPTDVANRFQLARMSGSHGVGHTRMATESAVTTKGAHPFTTGRDQCLVHNGSLSNHNNVRRVLRHAGMEFETENDSEVAAGFLSWRLHQGAGLREALGDCLEELDGFYTFVVGTENGFAVLRDPIACKPAIMAETDRYVAFGSEYRALVGLPDIDQARIFEPEPAKVYVWERS